MTEWNEFRALDLVRVREALKTPIVVDLRNIYDPAEMRELGFRYSCVGRVCRRERARAMTACHRFDPTILREYDIRGVVGRTLHDDDAALWAGPSAA